MSSLKNKVVLITGASSGIGAETAVHFAGLGCRLALNGRNEENLKAVVAKCAARGVSKENIKPIISPVDEKADCERIISETIKHFGRLDVLVNNAAIECQGGIETLDLDKFDQTMKINVRSVFIITQLAVPHLLKVKGNIVNVSSLVGTRPFPGLVGYCMSKAAINHMTKVVAMELAGRGVRVNAVNPGVILTDFQKKGGLDEKQYQKFLEACKKTHPIGRVGNPDEVAKAIAFLASDDASNTTGVLFPVDGGKHAAVPVPY